MENRQITYQMYMEQFGYGFSHDSCLDGQMFCTLSELLWEMRLANYPCPQIVNGGIPVKITIDADDVIRRIEDHLCDNEYTDDYCVISKEGEKFLKHCFSEYNRLYAMKGSRCIIVPVEVPHNMKYELKES